MSDITKTDPFPQFSHMKTRNEVCAHLQRQNEALEERTKALDREIKRSNVRERQFAEDSETLRATINTLAEQLGQASQANRFLRRNTK